MNLKIYKTIKDNLCFVLFMVCSICVNAQSDSNIIEVNSLEELRKITRARNPDVKSYLLNLEKCGYDVKASKATYLPSISGSFSGQKNIELATTPVPGEFFGQPGTTVNAQFGQPYAYNAGISLTKNLFDWQSTLKIKMAKLTYKTSEVQRDAYLILLDQQVNINYYSLLIAKRAIMLAEKDFEIADSISNISVQKFKEGLMDASALNQAKINANVTKQNLNNSKQLYSSTYNELKLLLGLRETDSLKIKENSALILPPEYNISELKPEERIKLASLNREQAQNQVNIQKSLFVPKLSLNGYYGKQQFKDDFGLDFGNNSWTDYRFIGLNLSVPIFNGFANRYKFKASKSDLDFAENEFNKTNLESRLQDIQLIEEYHTSLSNTKLTLEVFKLYEQNERLALQKYAEGLTSLDRYLYAFEDYLKAENAYLNALLTTYSFYSQIIPRI